MVDIVNKEGNQCGYRVRVTGLADILRDEIDLPSDVRIGELQERQAGKD